MASLALAVSQFATIHFSINLPLRPLCLCLTAVDHANCNNESLGCLPFLILLVLPVFFCLIRRRRSITIYMRTSRYIKCILHSRGMLFIWVINCHFVSYTRRDMHAEQRWSYLFNVKFCLWPKSVGSSRRFSPSFCLSSTYVHFIIYVGWRSEALIG